MEPVLREELRARVKARLERARLVRERAERDALTGHGYLAGDRVFRSPYSAGIAVAPQDGTDVEALLHHADERLYRAKTNGRNRIES